MSTPSEFIKNRRAAIVAALAPWFRTPEAEKQFFTFAIPHADAALMGRPEEEIIKAVKQAAAMGILPDGKRWGFFECRTTNGTPTGAFVPLVEGLLSVAHRDPNLAATTATVARVGDEFEVFAGTSPRIHHVQKSGEGEIIAAYAVLHYRGTPIPEFAVLWKPELDKRRKLTKGKAWDAWPDKVAATKALRAVLSRANLAPDILTALAADDDDTEPDTTPALVAAPAKPLTLLAKTPEPEPPAAVPVSSDRQPQHFTLSAVLRRGWKPADFEAAGQKGVTAEMQAWIARQTDEFCLAIAEEFELDEFDETNPQHVWLAGMVAKAARAAKKTTTTATNATA